MLKNTVIKRWYGKPAIIISLVQYHISQQSVASNAARPYYTSGTVAARSYLMTARILFSICR
jgi:hypothetical protein